MWDPGTATLLGRANGTWTDACLTPDGETVLAVDMSGRLVRLAVSDDLRTATVEPQDAPMTAVATDGHVLLAAFARLDQ